VSEKVITCKNISFLFLIENVITVVRFTYIHFIGFFFFKLKKKVITAVKLNHYAQKEAGT
jgi:phosphatidylglycerophosphate synthase